jgi:hypothetical protein
VAARVARADDAGLGDAAVLEEDLVDRRRIEAEQLLALTDADGLVLAVDDERDRAAPALGALQLREDDEARGARRVEHEALLARDRVPAIDATSLRREAGGRTLGLGVAERRDRARLGGEARTRLVVAAQREQELPRITRVERQRLRGVPPAELFLRDHRRGHARALAAVRLGEIEVTQAELRVAARHLHRRRAPLLGGASVRAELVLGERAHGLLDQGLVRVELE